MEWSLTRKQVQSYVERLKSSIRTEQCRTCDCLHGLLTQLELDCPEDVADLTAELKVGRDRMHRCLGCDPCPPGALFADHLRGCESDGPQDRTTGHGEKAQRL